ncbi:MAG TPA: M12 family metallo-peptidase, partial [Chitinophagales bacterium]|nr:M12 family metallo-peptidase [Chitinophagales bacterium]
MNYFLSLVFSMIMLNSFAATSLWQKVSGRNLTIEGERKIIPQIASLVQLNDADFRLFQKTIPAEGSTIPAQLILPTPDGGEMKFNVFESTCMEKALAEKYPMIKTYQAICVDNPFITAKLDYTEFGFHAMVFGVDGIYFIDPYSNVNTGYYNCYFKKDYTRADNNYSVCEVGDQIPGSQNRLIQQDNQGNSVTDGVRRTFRLALACTIEYSNAVAAPTVTKPRVLSAMVTSMNRVNGVYEKDLSIHMNLVAKNDTLIFIGSDNYSNNNGGAMLGENQTVCNARIGSANYDIGHVFSTGGGGVAFLGCVCNANNKARGVTGSSNPVGDAFDIDYVAHEMGHQFGANHTFNANSGSCSGNGNSSTAYEPGSGVTIMAYAGICGVNDIAAHSIDIFHRASIIEIFNYISGTSCAVITNSGNTPPTVTNYTATYSIPYKTSFEFTASATDPNGHAVNYCWEEWDIGPAGNWDAANNTTAPIFRSFVPTASGTRVFPRWDSLIRNVIKYKGEILPETTRDVKFRCTVRDIDANGYGAYNAPDNNLTIKSVTTATLFRVTSQATATTITGNTNQTVTWNVAGTTASPISCANVDIYLSLDSARTFPYLLASATANDGTESVLIPNVATNNASARIKVKGNGNVFFDLNDGWIKINPGTPPFAAAFTSSNTSICQGTSITFTNTSTGSPDSVRWTINGGTPSTSTSLTTILSTFNNSGTYTVSLTAYKAGVASTPFSTNITVNPKTTSSITQTICEGQSVTVGGQTFTTTQVNKVIVLPNANSKGCDSTITLNLTVNPKTTSSITQTICEGQSVTVGGQTFTTTQVNKVIVLPNANSKGCDSTITLNLTVNPKTTSSITQTICEGQSVTVGGQTFTTTQVNKVIVLPNA